MSPRLLPLALGICAVVGVSCSSATSPPEAIVATDPLEWKVVDLPSTASTSQFRGAAQQPAPLTATAAAAADYSEYPQLPPPQPAAIAYIEGFSFPSENFDLPTNTSAFVFRPSQTVSEPVAVRLASKLGLPFPDRTEVSSGVWEFTSEEGSLVFDSSRGQVKWWFSSSQDTGPQQGALWGEAFDPGLLGLATELPPDLIATLESGLSRFIVETGFSPDELSFSTTASPSFVTVSALATFTSDSDRISQSWSAGFDPSGRVLWASGTLPGAIEVGPYPLIDLQKAHERLMNSFYGQLLPLEDSPYPQTIDVLTVFADLMDVSDADGGLWLIPAYSFLADDGSWWSVPAIADEFMVAAEPTSPTSSLEALLQDPTVLLQVAEIFAEREPTLEDFVSTMASFDALVRVVVSDGVSFVVTEDFVPNRLNVVEVGGHVREVLSVG